MRYYLEISAFVSSSESSQILSKILDTDRYQVRCYENPEEFLKSIRKNQQQDQDQPENRPADRPADQQPDRQEVDCIVIQEGSLLESIIERLNGSKIILPTVIWCDQSQKLSPKPWIIHAAEVVLSDQEAEAFRRSIDRAIANFLYLSPTGSAISTVGSGTVRPDENAASLMSQQNRLAEKLKERLGYLGIYYKREPRFFLKNLPHEEKQSLLQELRSEYREIVLAYFAEDGTLNTRVDRFVEQAFFSDMAVAQVVEIHMELMDALATQLKLEGRSEEILLDYRLTLIDIIAHLCEMYRRSIPRE